MKNRKATLYRGDYDDHSRCYICDPEYKKQNLWAFISPLGVKTREIFCPREYRTKFL